MSWTLARRAARMNPSTIRELLKLTERPGIISLAGGLPSPDTFPVAAVAEATARVLHESPSGHPSGGPSGGASYARASLQYAASEGLGPLREWVAAELGAQGLRLTAANVLITSGSQQGLDLVGKVLIDPGSRVAVESPTYLGALQAFAPYEPDFVALPGDDEGPDPDALDAAAGARFAYLLPNFQNPSGRCLSAARRLAIVARVQALGLPVVEDNPYGELWYDAPPPPPLAATLGDAAVYLGSFSKVLAPGLRLGYVVAPPALMPKLLQAKQAADLHTPGFNQRIVYEVIKDGFLQRHVPTIRDRYRAQRDAMQQALLQHMPPGVRWAKPAGGMFFWLTLPAGLDATALLPRAVEAGLAFVPGAAFYPQDAAVNTLRLSFVTANAIQIATAVAALGGVLETALAAAPVTA